VRSVLLNNIFSHYAGNSTIIEPANIQSVTTQRLIM